jgi:hypothetical protein
MRLLFLGDVVGKSGRKIVQEKLPYFRRSLGADFSIVNGENAASGFGVTEQIVKDFISAGADAITLGDHCFDKKETKFFINRYPELVRPANFPKRLPGKGYKEYTVQSGRKILVIHLLCQLFMKYNVNCPFEEVTKILESYQLGKNIDYIIVDFHGEATSEKMAMAQFLDGKVSLVTGSHTHIPTCDTQILPNGTAYQTDAGMCGDYNSVIGFKKEPSIYSFVNKIRGEKFTPALEQATLCGTFVELDEKTGLAKNVDYIASGGRLKEHIPEF